MKQERLSKQSKVNRLDLGLSSILSSFGDTPVTSQPNSAPPSPIASSASGEPNFILLTPLGTPAAIATPPPPPEPPQKTEYQTLAEAERWNDLAQLCESRISKKDAPGGCDIVEARLWWIKSQLINGGVPMSILAAPLESVSASVLEFQKEGDRIGARERGLTEFCAELLKKVSGELTANSEHVLALSFLERAYALDKSCAPQLRSAVDRDLERLRKNPRAETDAKLKARAARLEGLRRELKLVKSEGPPASAAADEKTSEIPAVAPETLVVGRGHSRAYVLALALLVALAAGAWFVAPASLRGDRGELALNTVAPGKIPAAQLPELQRVSGVSNLDALYYDIDSAASKRRPEIPESPPKNDSAAASSQPEPSDVKQTKVVVNTTTPVEGAEFQNLTDESSERDGGRRDDLFADVAARTQAAVQGIPVEKFDSDKLFLIIAKTNVMARPSFHTAALAALESGDKVLVESKVGPWLKLRSKHGQAGYILAQDAELTTKRSPD